MQYLMQLKISTTQNTIAYEGEITSIILPTENGQKTIDSTSRPWMMQLLPGLIKITSKEGSVSSLSISKGIALIGEKNINITTSNINSTPLQKLTQLRSNQYLLELKLQKLRAQGAIEEINALILQLEKVKADIKLAESA